MKTCHATSSHVFKLDENKKKEKISFKNLNAKIILYAVLTRNQASFDF